MKRFEVYEMALQMIRALRPAVERIRQYDRDPAAQLKRAGSSVPGNIPKGLGARDRTDYTITESRLALPGKCGRTWRWPLPGVMWTRPRSRQRWPCWISSSPFSGA